MKRFRHGDLIIELIEKLPIELNKRKSNIILLGQKTLHAHRLIGGEILENSSKTTSNFYNKGKLIRFERKGWGIVEPKRDCYKILPVK